MSSPPPSTLTVRDSTCPRGVPGRGGLRRSGNWSRSAAKPRSARSEAAARPSAYWPPRTPPPTSRPWFRGWRRGSPVARERRGRGKPRGEREAGRPPARGKPRDPRKARPPARGKPPGERGPGPPAARGRPGLLAQVAILAAVFTVVSAVAELFGAANLGTALGIGQIAFAVAVVALMVWSGRGSSRKGRPR